MCHSWYPSNPLLFIQVFYTNMESNTIEAVWAHDMPVGVVMDSQQLHPRSITLDSNAGLLYWTDWGDSPSIRTAELDGWNHRQLISTDLKRPAGLTLDVGQAVLYWTDWEREVIEECDAAGNNRKKFQPLRLDASVGLANAGNHLYYTMPSLGSIMRLNKNQSVGQSSVSSALSALVMRIGLRNLSDVVVYEHKVPPGE